MTNTAAFTFLRIIPGYPQRIADNYSSCGEATMNGVKSSNLHRAASMLPCVC